VTAVRRRTHLICSGVAIAAAVTCAVTVGVPAVAWAGRASPPARRAQLAPRYRVVAKIRLDGLPLVIAEDPRTNTTYAAQQGPGEQFSVAVINNQTDKEVRRLPVFAYTLAFDSRTDAFYVPTATGVVVIGGRARRVIARLPVVAQFITVDPRTGHVYLAVHNVTRSAILVLSDRTNKVVDRIRFPASATFGPMAASPARGVIYAEVGIPNKPGGIWVIGTHSGKVLARIGAGGGLAVDDRNNVLAVLGGSSLTLVDGRTHKVRHVVGLLQGTPQANTDAVAVSPGTHTVFASAECDPGGWVDVVSERTGRILKTINGGLLRSLAVDRRRDVVFAVDYTGDDVLVIDARTNKVIAKLAVGVRPDAVAVDPVTGRAYVANFAYGTVSVLAPTGVSSLPAARSAAATDRAAVGWAANARRGVCG